jgi:hypothetical protein
VTFVTLTCVRFSCSNTHFTLILFTLPEKAFLQNILVGSEKVLSNEKKKNIRYLGQLATLCAAAGLTHVETLCRQEMMVRASKRLLADTMRGVKPDAGTTEEHWYATNL